jgi:hypothetical protein
MAKPRPGWKPTNGFKPGHAANPRGRPRGSGDRTPRNVWDILRNRGDRDPLDVLSEFASSQLVDPNLRIAAVALAGYRHGKRPPLRFVEGITGLKAPTTIEEARQYLARLAYLVAEGRIDLDGAAAIREQLQSYVDATVGAEVDQRLRVLEELARGQAARGGFGGAVTVVGGMPVLPGCETTLIMPNTAAPTIEHQPAKPNPWATPDAHVPKRKRGPGRPRKYADQVPEPPPTPDPPDDDP